MSGENLTKLSHDAKVALAIKHIQEGGSVLAYGHDSNPESIYANPKLYPGMFPWLFPYGLGGFDNTFMQDPVKRLKHTHSLLMYYDRRFQIDEYFPFLVFNQNQIKMASQGGYLLTEKKNFDHIAEKIMALNPMAIDKLIELISDFLRCYGVSIDDRAQDENWQP